ncbi:MAG TPA: LysM peptidoglycan-binding domain-containing protein, partial [Rhodothermales bacterium]|nr:LysM peptidoglycan-binding domain-containing protein [Rhodothermales bacterium]
QTTREARYNRVTSTLYPDRHVQLRYLFAGVLALCALEPATAQQTPRTTPPTPLGQSDAQKLAQEGPLTEAQILERLSRLYRYQSDILLAEARGDGEAVDALFELAMTELGRLASQEGIMESSVGGRFREVYRSVVVEYEKYYNVSPDDVAAERGDVFDLRADIFAALNDDERDPLLEDVQLPQLRQLQPVTGTTIGMPMNRLVESSIAYLMRTPERHLYNWVSRAETYFPMIEQIFAEEGVPDELKYLAMIESGLNPRAQSWAAAVGMWQFIRATGSAYGLRVDTYVDERMDPEKATRAAARHLRDLYEQYGQDWHLAIAGYNCSPRGVNRAINLAKARGVAQPTFWDIYQDLPRETRNYVPMFIAAAIVASNPQALDRSKITPGPAYAYDLIPVRGGLSLADVATMAGTTEDVIRAFNPSLRRNSLPTSREYFPLRLPQGSGETFLAAARGTSGGGTNEVTYTVKRGDTITRIARQYGVTEDALRARNGNEPLAEGMTLYVPTEAPVGRVDVAMNEVRSVAFDARPRMRIAAGSSGTSRPLPPRTTNSTRPASSRPAVATQPDRVTDEDRTPEVPVTNVSSRAERTTAAARSRASSRVVYRVRRGDTMSELAERYDVTVGQIRQWNNLSGSTLPLGRTIYLYPDGGAPTTERVSSRTERRAAETHTVRRGETLASIARRYGVTVSNLRAWNGVGRNGHIEAGQRLKVSADGRTASSRTSSRAARAPQTHRVRSGENLTTIARQHDVSVRELMRWNNLRSANIRPGQRLKLRG